VDRNVLHVCRTLLAREHKRIRAEYEERVKQLEQERQGVEEERVQVALHTIQAQSMFQFFITCMHLFVHHSTAMHYGHACICFTLLIDANHKVTK